MLFRRRLTAADVIWCYETLLLRAPESDQVVAEKLALPSFQALVTEIVSSSEYQERNSPLRGVTHEDVIWCYQNLLNRLPESTEVVDDKAQHRSISELVRDLITSEEFRSKCIDTENLQTVLFEFVFGRSPDSGEQLSRRDFEKTLSALHRKLCLLENLQPELTTDTVLQLLIFQTCDHEKYVPMVQETSRTVLEYVRRWRCDYEIFYGIKRGCHPWHATFNRIFKLDELVRSNYTGWVLYLDADAYFVSFDFDIKGFLAANAKYAIIAASAFGNERPDTHYWNINAGVFFINLGHPMSREIVSAWKRYYEILYTPDDFRMAGSWDDVINDQTSLHAILKNPQFESVLLIDGMRELFNSRHASLIRQALRIDHSTNDDQNIDQRLCYLQREIASVFGSLS
jgi:hypothetical protein